MNRMVTIVIADDHKMLRQCVGAVLSQNTGIQVLSDVGTTDEAIDACIQLKPDVAVMDIDIPGVDSFEAARTIRARSPRTRIVFLSAFTLDRYIESALRAGALGYVAKSEPIETVVRAIHAVAAGQCYFSPEVHSRIVIDDHGPVLCPEAVATRASTLTGRETEVLRYLAHGKSKKEIAGLMCLSVKTVENHVSNIMMRLDIHDRVELTLFAIREGMVTV
ncbi:MAG: response regulator transcription factor [Phycisphaerales bacterium]